MVTEKEYELVSKRLEAWNEKFLLCSIGSGNFTKDQMLEHVKAKDETGEILAKIQLNYLRRLKER